MEDEKSYLRLVVGISGASGVIYGLRTLEILHSLKIETHVVLSQWGEKNIEIETDKTGKKSLDMASMESKSHNNRIYL